MECSLWIVSERTLVCVLLVRPSCFSLVHCYYWWTQKNKGEWHSSVVALVLVKANGITSAEQPQMVPLHSLTLQIAMPGEDFSLPTALKMEE